MREKGLGMVYLRNWLSESDLAEEKTQNVTQGIISFSKKKHMELDLVEIMGFHFSEQKAELLTEIVQNFESSRSKNIAQIFTWT